MKNQEVVDVEMNEEIRKKLEAAGVLGYQIDAKFPYVPNAFKVKDKDDYIIPKKLWTVFFLKSIDGFESAELEDLQRGNYSYDSVEGQRINGMSIKTNSSVARVETLRRGLLGWNNFRDIKGKLIAPWKKDSIYNGASEGSIRFIHPDLQVELCNAMENQAFMTEEELLGLGL